MTPATLSDGTPAVLKLNFPEPESEHEAEALVHWNGEGAVRLLAYDPGRRALLVERCEPGTLLWDVPDEDEANVVAARVLLRLWRPPPAGHRFRLLEDEATRWAESLPGTWKRLGCPFERSLLDAGIAAMRELSPTQGERVVTHQDFHGGNVLRAAREPWLAIDPKPLVGEREFDTASLVRDRRDGLVRDSDPAGRIRRRLDQLAADLELDRERMRGWGIAHALEWGTQESGVLEDVIACARWLSDAG